MQPHTPKCVDTHVRAEVFPEKRAGVDESDEKESADENLGADESKEEESADRSSEEESADESRLS